MTQRPASRRPDRPRSPDRLFRRRPEVPVVFLAMCLILPPAGHAAQFGCSNDAADGHVPAESVPPTQAGQRVYIDPQTGELLDEPPPGAVTQPADTPAAEPVIPVYRRPDGTVVADIGRNFMHETRIEVVDGKAVTCHRNPKSAVAPSAATPEPPENAVDDRD